MIKFNSFVLFLIVSIGSTDVAASSYGLFHEPPGPGEGPTCTHEGETYPNGAHVYENWNCEKYYCNAGEIKFYWFSDCGLHNLMGEGVDVSKCTKTYREGVCCPRYDCPPEAYPEWSPEEYSTSSSEESHSTSPEESYSSSPEEYSTSSSEESHSTSPEESYSSSPVEYSSSPPDPSPKIVKCGTAQ